MSHIANKPIPKLRKAPQPPLAYAGAAPDSDRWKCLLPGMCSFVVPSQMRVSLWTSDKRSLTEDP